MKKDRFTRKAHPRQLSSGYVTTVREALVRRQGTDANEKTSYFHPCRMCGATILTRRLPNGIVTLTARRLACAILRHDPNRS